MPTSIGVQSRVRTLATRAPAGDFRPRLQELLAARRNRTPPAWTKEIGALSEPFFLLRSARNDGNACVPCVETQAPGPIAQASVLLLHRQSFSNLHKQTSRLK